ncbi:MAG: hypothetical protein R3288_08895 [Woeseiaceae bacterium]|nr:hypothetical protein [Woeseiaceae bacterium]
MEHTTSSGTIRYQTDGSGPDGIERFQITRFANGRRQLSAVSELWNDRLVRDTFLSVDEHFRPELAHVHLAIGGEPVGAAQYRIDGDRVTFTAHSTDTGPQSAQMTKPVTAFGGHALQNDAWMMAAADRRAGDRVDRVAECVLVTSHLPNGGDGPALEFSRHRYRFLGCETLDAAAGRFETRHFEFLLDDRPPIHYWTAGPDYLLVRARWDLLRQSYELVEFTQSG